MSGFAEKFNVQICINSTKNCVHYKYEMSGFEEKLIVQSCVKSMGNCVHYMYGMSGFAEKLNIPNSENSTGNCVHYLCTASQICRKIESPKQRKFNLKLCTIHVRNVWICRKLNIQNCVNSTENCVHYIRTKCLDLQKN